MPKNSNSFRLRFQYYKQTGKLPYKAGRVNEELPTDAVLSRQMPIEIQQDPLGMLKRLDIARANAANVTAMLNQAQIGTDTRTRSEIQRGNRQAAVDRLVQREVLLKLKNEEAFWNLVNLTSPSTYIGQAIGLPLTGDAALATDVLTFGAVGALKSGFKAAVRGAKNAAETLRYGALGKPRVSKDYIYSITPNIQELSLYLKPSLKQTRIIKEDTYPTYIGPKHSVSEVVNADGTVNPRAAMKILHEVADNIPGAYRMENRLENPVWHLNDPTTYHHTRDVARRAWRIDTPSGYTKQDLMIAALGHDFGKIVTGDGHAKIGADLLRQIFPDITDLQLLAIREHMGPNLTTPLSVATKRADNIVENPLGLLSDEPLIARGVLPNQFGRIETQMVDFGDDLKTLEHWLHNVPDKDFYDAIGVSKIFFKDRYKNDEKFIKLFRQRLNQHMFNKSLTDISATPEVMLERSKLTHLFNSDWYKSHLDGRPDKDAFIRSQLLAVNGVLVFSYKVPKVGIGGYYVPDPISGYGKVFIDDNIKNGGLFYSAQRSGNIGHELGHAAGSDDLIHSNEPAVLEEGSYQASKPEYYADYDETRTRFLNVAANELWESRNPDLVFDRRMETIPNSNYSDVFYGYNREFAKRYMQTFKSLFPYLIGGGLAIPKLNK